MEALGMALLGCIFSSRLHDIPILGRMERLRYYRINAVPLLTPHVLLYHMVVRLSGKVDYTLTNIGHGGRSGTSHAGSPQCPRLNLPSDIIRTTAN
jgi:hypothetical protein